MIQKETDKTMQYSEYGKTGKKVSAVGFGGMRFDTTLSTEENAELVRYANSQGINYFDTAPGYCNSQSEKIFGEAFKDMPGQYYVSTKGMPQTFDTAKKAREGVKRSMDTMGIDKIDFYHVWCLRKMEHYHLAMKKGGQYEGLLRCKEEGLIDHIVFSSHQPGHEIRQILDEGHFEGVLMGINVLNFPYRWDGVLAAAEHSCGVVAMNPLGGGMIPEHRDALGFLAKDGEDTVEAALRFVVSCPQINVALNGFTTREHIDTAVRVAADAKPFTDEDLARIRQNLSGAMNEVCTACGYCVKGCPQKIPIPAYMVFYNQHHMFGTSEEEMTKLLANELTWGTLVGRQAEAADCIECGKCEKTCTQHLDIMDRLKTIAGWQGEE